MAFTPPTTITVTRSLRSMHRLTETRPHATEEHGRCFHSAFWHGHTAAVASLTCHGAPLPCRNGPVRERLSSGLGRTMWGLLGAAALSSKTPAEVRRSPGLRAAVDMLDNSGWRRQTCCFYFFHKHPRKTWIYLKHVGSSPDEGAMATIYK